jgi:rubrerythrin
MRYAPRGFQEDDTSDVLASRETVEAARGNPLCHSVKAKRVPVHGLSRCYHCGHLFDGKAGKSDILCPCCE